MKTGKIQTKIQYNPKSKIQSNQIKINNNNNNNNNNNKNAIKIISVCASDCATCSDASSNGCLTCSTGLVLDGGICVSSCSKSNSFVNSNNVCQGHFFNHSIIQSFNYSIIQFFNHLSSIFHLLLLSFPLLFSHCFTFTLHTKLKPSSIILSDCDPSCATCSGPDDGSCLSCSNSSLV